MAPRSTGSGRPSSPHVPVRLDRLVTPGAGRKGGHVQYRCFVCEAFTSDTERYEAFYPRAGMRVSMCRSCLGEIVFNLMPGPTDSHYQQGHHKRTRLMPGGLFKRNRRQ